MAKSRRKVDLLSRDPEILANSVREILGDKKIREPLDAFYILNALQRLPFVFWHSFDKIRSHWVVSNQDQSLYHGKELYAGLQIIAVDYTFEIAAARAIHYYYHYELCKEKNLVQGDI